MRVHASQRHHVIPHRQKLVQQRKEQLYGLFLLLRIRAAQLVPTPPFDMGECLVKDECLPSEAGAFTLAHDQPLGESAQQSTRAGLIESDEKHDRISVRAPEAVDSGPVSDTFDEIFVTHEFP
ncbi:hypothetical protein AMK20_22850 [Streptomyces sp. TSRI0261]|nr:hypothetical protein AMK20_22850 [Streptomyces sp. TSRI0261]